MIAWILAAAFIHPSMNTLEHASPAAIVQGHELFEQHCASCHGAQGDGSSDAPSLHGTGAAAVDFWISTGRMPAAVPWLQVDHQPLRLPPGEIVSIEQYLHHQDSSGPAIPVVAQSKDLARGRQLFTQNCEHCHGVSGAGASISNNQWAPNLHLADPTQIAEAIRTGPAEMPLFSTAQLSPDDVNDLVAYVTSLDRTAKEVQLPAGTSGPVPEGLIGWLVVLLLCIVAYFYSKAASPKSK